MSRMTMRFTTGRTRSALQLIALAAFATMQACGSDGGNFVGNMTPGSIAIALDSRTMTLVAGNNGTVPVTITRTNVTDNVALTAENLPSGVTASFDPQSVSGNGSTLTVRTTAAAVAGSYDVLVKGTSSGGPTATTTLSLTVTLPPPPGLTFKFVAASSSSTCALTTAGKAYCWGGNLGGELGNGTISTASATPTAVSGGFTFQSLAVPDGRYVCGLRDDGAAYCWGWNTSGQTGNGTIDTILTTPTAVVGGLHFVSLASGASHTCGLTVDGVVYCWGDNTSGVFGDGTVTSSLSPVIAASGMHFKTLTAGLSITCGTTSADAAYCWGQGTNSQLGNGSNQDALTPVAVSGGIAFKSLTLDALGACGVTNTGDAYCWGHNMYGDVGDGTTTPRLVPTAVAGGLRFADLRVGFEHTCGVDTVGAAYCWGYNIYGELGDGTLTHRSVPTPVLGGFKFQSVSIGFGHACGITEIVGGANDIYCWGLNTSGQLGDGTTTSGTAPRKVQFPH
ncbi:MAG: hypothetical protein ABJE10_20395 [bacterium]